MAALFTIRIPKVSGIRWEVMINFRGTQPTTRTRIKRNRKLFVKKDLIMSEKLILVVLKVMIDSIRPNPI